MNILPTSWETRCLYRNAFADGGVGGNVANFRLLYTLSVRSLFVLANFPLPDSSHLRCCRERARVS